MVTNVISKGFHCLLHPTLPDSSRTKKRSSPLTALCGKFNIEIAIAQHGQNFYLLLLAEQ